MSNQGIHNDNNEDSCPAVRQLLEDDITQLETVCMDIANLPAALNTTDTNNLTITVNAAIPNLTQFFTDNPLYALTDLFYAGKDLFTYSSFDFVCLSNGTDDTMQYDVLCDTTNDELSISKSGEYMTEANAASFGAIVFSEDRISTQVATAIKALCGFFGLNLLIIVIYLAKSKWQK